MRRMLIFWFMAVGLNGAERSVDAHGLNVRSFADDGRLLRRFIAESASGPFASPVVKLEFSSQPQEIQDVTFDEAALKRYQEIMEELRVEVNRLDDKLARVE